MLRVNIDLGELGELLGAKGIIEKQAREAAQKLSMMIHAKATELANQQLNTRREKFLNGMSWSYSMTDDAYLVTLAEDVRWIDDGLPEHNMLADLLASPKAKTAKDGSKYLIIPFNHSPGQGKTKATPAQQDLISTVKSALKSRNIPFGKIEKNADGSAKTGKLHSFSIKDSPTKKHEGPGQGKGPMGAVKQGPTGIPFLQGVNVYQHNMGKDPKTGKEIIKRHIGTFRIASSKHMDEAGRWDHPGTKAVNILDQALDWAHEEWAKSISPEILANIIAEIG